MCLLCARYIHLAIDNDTVKITVNRHKNANELFAFKNKEANRRRAKRYTLESNRIEWYRIKLKQQRRRKNEAKNTNNPIENAVSKGKRPKISHNFSCRLLVSLYSWPFSSELCMCSASGSACSHIKLLVR